MDNSKNKKEKMRVVSYSFFLVFLLYFTSCSAQVISTGEYIGHSKNGMYTLKLQILKNSTFILTKYEYENVVPIKSRGYYVLNKAQLVLVKEKINHNHRLGYTIDSLNLENEGVLVMNISVFDEANKGMPFEGAFLVIAKNDNAILTFFTNKQGKQSVHIYDASIVNFLKVGFFGYKTVEVPLEKLMGKSVTVSVTLNPEEIVYDDVGKFYFDVIEFDDRQLSLKSTDGEIIELKKQDD